MTAFSALVGVTLRGLLNRRRIILMTLLAGIPVVLAAFVYLRGGRPDVDRVLGTLVVQTVMPLVALVLGTAALGSEIEDGTAVYLLAKPVPRWQVALAKIVVAILLTAALVVPSVVLTGLLVGRGGSEAIGVTLAFAFGCFVGCSAYASAFVALSAFTSRALVLGLAYVLLWEGSLGGLLKGTRFLSIRQATLGLVDAAGGKVSGETLAADVSVIVLTVVIVGSFLLASWKLARFEVRGGD
jgi:ABC-2 type transport system permease protein